jgi:hypothetical protein
VADTETLLRRSARLDLDGIDFGAFVDDPLDEDTLRCLQDLHDVEQHTVCYLRDLLVTRAHRAIDRLPGLAGLRLLETAVGRAAGGPQAAEGTPEREATERGKQCERG